MHKPNKRGIGTVRHPRTVPRDEACAKKRKRRTLTNLYNERPTWLDLAHQRLDEAVFAAYGWGSAWEEKPNGRGSSPQATKLTYEDLVEGRVSRDDVLGLLAAGEVEVDAVARYLSLLESNNGQNGGGARLKVSDSREVLCP